MDWVAGAAIITALVGVLALMRGLTRLISAAVLFVDDVHELHDNLATLRRRIERLERRKAA